MPSRRCMSCSSSGVRGFFDEDCAAEALSEDFGGAVDIVVAYYTNSKSLQNC